MAELVLGIDGGGSKTRALLADRDGVVLGIGTAVSSNHQSVGFDAATTALQNAIAGAISTAAVDRATPIVAACLGLAGVDRPEDQMLFRAWADQHAIAPRVTIVNDAELVLAAGTPEGWGVALICGTGSICYGRTQSGETARAGGWGHLLGDEGSGYDLGVRALRLATQTADGRAGAQRLLQAILDHWHLAQPDQLIGYVYRPATRAEIAGIARLVADLAANGDPHAQNLLDGAAQDLGQLIAAVTRKLDLACPPIALGGGFIGANPDLQEAVCVSAGVALGPHQYVDDPARGAVVLAQRLLP